jgi:hypothetical protein
MYEFLVVSSCNLLYRFGIIFVSTEWKQLVNE